MTDEERVGLVVHRLKLSRSQAVILLRLHEAGGNVVNVSQLRGALYPNDADDPLSDTVRVFIHQLRKRFGGDIISVPDCGYLLSMKGRVRVETMLGLVGVVG